MGLYFPLKDIYDLEKLCKLFSHSLIICQWYSIRQHSWPFLGLLSNIMHHPDSLSELMYKNNKICNSALKRIIGKGSNNNLQSTCSPTLDRMFSLLIPADSIICQEFQEPIFAILVLITQFFLYINLKSKNGKYSCFNFIKNMQMNELC